MIPVRELGEASGVHHNTISNMENRKHARVQEGSSAKLRSYLERFVTFIEPESVAGSGVRLRLGVTPGCWRDPSYDGQALTPVEEGGAQLLEYFDTRRADWAALPEPARAALLVAIFGVVPDVDPLSQQAAE